MKEIEIAELINQKSKPTRQVYYNLFKMFRLIFPPAKYNRDFYATLTYNCTQLFINDILNNQQFYTPLFEIQQKEIETMQYDYDNMEHIDYPDEYSYLDIPTIETMIIDALSESHKKVWN